MKIKKVKMLYVMYQHKYTNFLETICLNHFTKELQTVLNGFQLRTTNMKRFIYINLIIWVPKTNSTIQQGMQLRC